MKEDGVLCLGCYYLTKKTTYDLSFSSLNPKNSKERAQLLVHETMASDLRCLNDLTLSYLKQCLVFVLLLFKC